MDQSHFPEKKRADSRLDVFWAAEMTLEGKRYPCQLSNVSTAGALLKSEENLALKQELILHIPDFGEAGGIVVWRNAPLYGLKLLIGDNLKLKEYADEVGLDNHR
ncbi:PilZ domain-containing protein [Luteithermobacter gelatinilyticus]|uniref:PilZ domain-containing protein n=1 Tax=Luteithermobacter gelatinilyticus TaxID=2582913 RepID=UPI001106389C|nr:PilZ domain-containing protein [Luteithermobacter gelatinilyticus]|tara:strand:+ start:1988 stop:2302 length:315 start_codon:yes stop_codon:yes gene_type:complete